jgi:hypothetical protein
VASFPTTEKAQMRRCRIAQLYGRTISEAFEGGEVTGYVQGIRADFLSSPMRWVIMISQKDTTHRNPENDSRCVRSLISELHA